ncbi:MAG: hypothetical protein C4582_02650 [Desulfobacteraceae bacterium]|nr:MAG: hypothetical protein C4582_02650 [Desulfobacteraceae bacterium]
MPPVIPDSIRNPDIKAWIPAPGSGSGTGFAGVTIHFHIKAAEGSPSWRGVGDHKGRPIPRRKIIGIFSLQEGKY